MRSFKKKKVMMRKFNNAKPDKLKKRNLFNTTRVPKKLRKKRKLRNIQAALAAAKAKTNGGTALKAIAAA